VLAVDTNVLVYAADADSQFHVACRGSSANGRDHHLGDPYEFLRVTTHGHLELSPFCPFSRDFALVPSLGTCYMKPCG
jgi:hypothetical protein